MRIVIEDLSGKRYQVFVSCFASDELIIVEFNPDMYRRSGYKEVSKIQQLLSHKMIKHEIVRGIEV